MAWKNMDVAPINIGDQKSVAFEYQEILTAPGDGVSVLLPDEIRWFSTTMSFTGGATGKIQWTTDLVSVVKSGAGITWEDSWWGEADETYTDLYPGVLTAIRIVQTGAGTMKVTMRAQ